MRTHLLKLAVGEFPLSSVVTMGVDANGAIHLSAAGVAPEHARSLLEELDTLRAQLQAFVESNQAWPGRVVPFPG